MNTRSSLLVLAATCTLGLLLISGLAACGGSSDSEEANGPAAQQNRSGANGSMAARDRQDQLQEIDSLFAPFVASVPDAGAGEQQGANAGGASQEDPAYNSRPPSRSTPDPSSTRSSSQDRPNQGEQGQDAERESSSNTRSASTQTTYDQTRTLEFTSAPTRVRVTVRNTETGQRYEEVTPVSFSVPPGQYTWTASKDGYATKEADRPLDLERMRRESMMIELSEASQAEASGAEASTRENASDVPGARYVELGDQAYQEEDYERALRNYQQAASSSDVQGTGGFLRVQGRLGELYWKERENYERAVQAYETVLEQDPTRYQAHLNLARIAFDTENYEEVDSHLDRVDRLRYQIPADRRLPITLEVQYLRGAALHSQAVGTQSRNQKLRQGRRALQSLLSFVESVPPELEGRFQPRIQDANQKLEEIRTLLRTTN